MNENWQDEPKRIKVEMNEWRKQQEEEKAKDY